MSVCVRACTFAFARHFSHNIIQNEKRRTNDGKVLVEELKISYRIRIGIVVFVCALHRVFVGFVFQKLR